MISIFVILGVKERYEVFIELKIIYENERNEIFKEFFAYFSKNWLNEKIVDFSGEREVLERTNNGREGFHSYLSKNINFSSKILENLLGKPHPRPAFLVEKLKNYELQLRLDATTKFKDGDSQNKKNSQIKKCEQILSLPFQKFLHRINCVYEDLKKKPSSLRSVMREKAFLKDIEELSLDLEDVIYFSNIVDDEVKVIKVKFIYQLLGNVHKE